jgi:hypothetical protein
MAEKMTAREKVLAVYPDARSVRTRGNSAWAQETVRILANGGFFVLAEANTTATAWARAARSITKGSSNE